MFKRFRIFAAFVGFPALAMAILLAVLPAPSVRAANGDDGRVLGQSRPQGYLDDNQTAAFRSQITGNDGTVASVWTQTYFWVRGRAVLSIGGRFSDAPATATIYVARYSRQGTSRTFKGLTGPLTLTAGSVTDSDSRYVSEDLLVDMGGSHEVRILCTAVSAGNVSLWAGSF